MFNRKLAGERLTALIISLCIIVTAVPIDTIAKEESPQSVGIEYEENEYEVPVGAEVTASSIRTVEDVIAQSKFTYGKTGHGFAAEQGNNLIDSIKGRNTSVVGDNNIKNGADRQIINRDGSVILIQDKYYKTATSSVEACFDSESGEFRYFDSFGNPMQIEVPSDQYDEAVAIMRNKILEGKIAGITDPDEAESIVRKGNLTYNQAKNLAKAGTVESLTYDAVNGVISAGCAFGISTLLNYTVCRLNGQDRDKALKNSAVEGVRSGIGVFCTSVIAGQLTKAGVMNVFKPTSEALTNALGEDFSKALLKAYGQTVIADEGESVALSATKQAAQLLRSQVLVTVVTTIVFSVPDAVDVYKGRISKKQFVKNFAVTAVSVVAGMVGYGVGGAVGNLIVPGVGTFPGGVVGSILIGMGGGLAADLIADYITDDDADEMYEILADEFVQLCDDYLVNEEEAGNIADQFGNMLDNNLFKDMYQSDDREQFAVDILQPLFDDEVAKREEIEAPTEEEMRCALKDELKGVVFIH